MTSSIQSLLVVEVLVLSAVLGGGMYEHLVIDPAWPKRPDLIQPGRGGISRGRFWLPAHLLFEILLLCSLVMAWRLVDIRFFLLATLGMHIATRLWSAFDFIPKALAFEKADIVDETLAKRWTFKSQFRIPMELLTLILFDESRAHRIRAVMKSRRKRWTASGDRSQEFLTIRVIVDCDIEEREGQ